MEITLIHISVSKNQMLCMVPIKSLKHKAAAVGEYEVPASLT